MLAQRACAARVQRYRAPVAPVPFDDKRLAGIDGTPTKQTRPLRGMVKKSTTGLIAVAVKNHNKNPLGPVVKRTPRGWSDLESTVSR
jgi:hypothetical protein